jgi:predicted glutamine amidotransferase
MGLKNILEGKRNMGSHNNSASKFKHASLFIRAMLVFILLVMMNSKVFCEDYALMTENCRLLGAVIRPGSSQSYVTSILDSFRKTSFPQHSGWSLSIFSNYLNGGKLSIPGEPMIIRSDRFIDQDLAMYQAISNLCSRMLPDVVIGHIRNASSGCVGVGDPHPFVLTVQGKHYLFIHNGSVWGQDYSVLVDDLLKGQVIPQNCPGSPVDSEFLFHYLIKIMVDYRLEPFEACQIWASTLVKAFGNEWNALNIILTDGESLWAVRCSSSSSRFPLHYTQFGHSIGYAVSTESLEQDWIPLENFTVARFRTGCRPRIEPLDLEMSLPLR